MGFLTGKKALITGVASNRSIAYGIAIGFIAYVAIKALSLKHKSLNIASVGIAIVSVLFFVFS